MVYFLCNMGIPKSLTVSSKRATNGTYSVLLQRIGHNNNHESLLFEAGAVAVLDGEETEQIRRQDTYMKIKEGYTCLGVLQFSHGESKNILYLVLVTGCVSVGRIQQSEIFRITDTVLLSLRNNSGDTQIIQGVRRLFNSGAFYFSYTSDNTNTSSNAPTTTLYHQEYDITLSSQRAQLTNTTDNRFFWNRVLFRHLERYNVNTSKWLVKTICGGVNITTLYIVGQQLRGAVISRVSCERAGTRFNVRGVNDNGHVANFVETEQLIFVGNNVLSYIIVRGSIPLFWEQPGLQVGSHRIKMSRGSEISQPAYDKHMLSLKERYTNVTMVNLLGSKDSEIILNHLFDAHHKTSITGKEFPFVNFNYHSLCPRGNKDNLEKLYACQLERICQEQGFFRLVSPGQKVISLQRGIYRVNCLDCLDRTNSFQYFIALKMLAKMLLDSFGLQESAKLIPHFKEVFGSSWIQNGDHISRIYTGTGALEGKSILKDGTLSVARTIQNNLLDGSKQCAIDLLVVGKPLNRDYDYRSSLLLPYYFRLAPSNILISMCDRYLEYCYPDKIKVVVATWNVNGGKQFKADSRYNRPISDWLVDYRSSTGESSMAQQNEKPVDIYAIGFQEIVDLNASNIVAASGENQRQWLAEIRRTISRNENQYLLVTSVQLVGVCLFVFVRTTNAPFVKDVATDHVKTGLRGATGNKGGVSIRLRYKSSSLCFVCAHFAAGQNQMKERNDDYNEITRRLQFPVGRSINSHDYIFWCGDFNYRLDKISNEDVRRTLKRKELDSLLEFDQLRISQRESSAFKDYIEGKITFAPTYKYNMNSNDYDTSEKCRTPAWTDRILFKKRHATHHNEILTNSEQIKFYNRIELMSSDHRPVIAEYDIEVLNVDSRKRNEVFESVLMECGPPDSTILIRLIDPYDETNFDIGDAKTVETILKLLADEAGEIVLARFVDNDKLRVAFRDGRTALKALKLNRISLGTHFVLDIRLTSENWSKIIKDELSSAMDNTINMITGERPRVILEDDDDQIAQELNRSIGPLVESESFCDGDNDNLLVQFLEDNASGNDKSGNSVVLQHSSTRHNGASMPVPIIDLIDDNPSFPLEHHTSNIETLADTSDLMELSSIVEYESQPPPSMPPPPLPSTPPVCDTPVHLVPPTRPVRKAPPPPPPVPTRSS